VVYRVIADGLGMWARLFLRVVAAQPYSLYAFQALACSGPADTAITQT